MNYTDVAHLVWLRHNQKAKGLWDSVYQNIFVQAVETALYDTVNVMSRGLQISIAPPDIGSCDLAVNTISSGNANLITRITKFSLNNFPFKKVYYTHPAIKEKSLPRRLATATRAARWRREF